MLALSLRNSLPVRVPGAVGLKLTFMVQLVPGARRAGQLLLCRKSPVTLTVRNSGIVPTFLTDTGWDALLVPIN